MQIKIGPKTQSEIENKLDVARDERSRAARTEDEDLEDWSACVEALERALRKPGFLILDDAKQAAHVATEVMNAKEIAYDQRAAVLAELLHDVESALRDYFKLTYKPEGYYSAEA